MLDRVPVPTDNIYKFIALFSLVALIFCAWQVLSISTTTNLIIFTNYPEIEELKSLKTPSRAQEAKLSVLERQIEVATGNRRDYNRILGGAMAISIWGLFYGFLVWHKEIQPMADAQNKAQLEILQLQIEKLRLENQKLEDSLKTIEPQQPAAPSAPKTSVLAEVVRVLLAR